MIELQQGGNTAIGGSVIVVRVDGAPEGGVEIDVSAYLLTDGGKVRGDHDMVFYNQPNHADGAIRYSKSGGSLGAFEVDLSKIPSAITRITFCVTIDNAVARQQTLAQVSNARISVGDIGYAPNLNDASEAAMIMGELYLRNAVWKFRAVGQGFNGGLDPLARSFGIDVADEKTAASPLIDRVVSLEKRVAADAPRLVNLAKSAAISLAKNSLWDVSAQVALVLDRSGSMTGQYKRGKVQDVIDRILPLATHFDDDGALDVWVFGASCKKLTPVTLKTVDGYIEREAGGWQKWPVGWTNDEPKVIEDVISKFTSAKPPAYVIFISDGGVGSATKIKKLLLEASSQPIFWQFVGLSGSNYGILEKLDTMAGRRVDNCNFFALDDLSDISDERLYDRLLSEFPIWLKAAKAEGILR